MPVVLRPRKNDTGTISFRCDVHYKGYRKCFTYDEKVPAPPPDNATPNEIRDWKRTAKRIEDAAQKWRDALATDIAQKKAGMVQTYDDGQLMRPYLEKLSADAQGSDYSIVRGAIKSLLAYLPSGAIWADIDEDCLQGWINSLAKTMTSGSIQNYLGKIKAIIRTANKQKLCKANIKTMDLRIPRAKAYKVKQTVTPAEVQLLADTPCTDQRIYLAFLASYYTSLSFKDIFMLRREHIVDMQYNEQPIRVIVKPRSKTGEEQFVPVIAILQEIIDQAQPWGCYIFDLPGRYEEKGLSAHDRQKQYAAAWKICNRVLHTWIASAEITKKINWHNIRHSTVTNMNASLSDIKGIAGHTNEKMTQGYQHARLDNSLKAISTLPVIRLKKQGK